MNQNILLLFSRAEYTSSSMSLTSFLKTPWCKNHSIQRYFKLRIAQLLLVTQNLDEEEKLKGDFFPIRQFWITLKEIKTNLKLSL